MLFMRLKNMQVRFLTTLFVIFMFCALVASADSLVVNQQTDNSKTSAPDFKLTDTTGKVHTPAEWQQSKAVVLLFVGADCPISNGYAPEINRIQASYTSKQVA